MDMVRSVVLFACFLSVVFNMGVYCGVPPGENSLLAADGARQAPQLALPTPTAEQLRQENRDPVVTATFSPSGKYLGVGMRSGNLVVLDMARGKLAFVHEAHAKPLKMMDFAADDRYLLTGADDLNVCFWDLSAKKLRLTFQGAPMRSLYAIAISPDGHYAAARGFDGFGVLWDLQKDRKVTDLFAYMFAFNPTRKFLVTAPGREPGAQLIRLGQEAESLHFAQEQSVGCLAIDPTGRLISYATRGWDKPSHVVLADGNTGRTIREYTISQRGNEDKVGVMALCFSRDGRQLVIGRTDGCVQCLDTDTMQVQRTYRFLGSVMVGHVECAGPQGGYVVALGWADGPERETRCWKMGATEPVWTKPGAVTLDAKRMIGARVTSDGDLEVCDAKNGQRLAVVRGYVRGTRWRNISD